LRSTLLTLAGADAIPSAAVSERLSMRTGQGYAEFAVSTFGSDAAIGDPDPLPASGTQRLGQRAGATTNKSTPT